MSHTLWMLLRLRSFSYKSSESCSYSWYCVRTGHATQANAAKHWERPPASPVRSGLPSIKRDILLLQVMWTVVVLDNELCFCSFILGPENEPKLWMMSLMQEGGPRGRWWRSKCLLLKGDFMFSAWHHYFFNMSVLFLHLTEWFNTPREQDGGQRAALSNTSPWRNELDSSHLYSCGLIQQAYTDIDKELLLTPLLTKSEAFLHLNFSSVSGCVGPSYIVLGPNKGISSGSLASSLLAITGL